VSCDLTFAGNRKHLGKIYGRIEDAAAEALAVLRPASPARVIQLNTR
jgi:hypothetical protein